MRTILLIFGLALLAANSFAQSAGRSGKDYAVFFYVTKFQAGWPSLPETATEAQQLKTELQTNFGFQTELVANPTRQQILDKIKAYNTRLTADDQVLFFFSMHGYYDPASDLGYLVAADGLADDPYFTSWIDYNSLRPYFAKCKAKHVLVALDACYSGSFGSRNRSGPDKPAYAEGADCVAKIAATFRYTGRQYVCSGNKAAKTPAKSLFAAKFLEALRKGPDGDGLLYFDDLAYWLGKVKNPEPENGYFTGHEPAGDFVFVRNSACPQPAVEKVAAMPDRDADGVPDQGDQCPDTKGLPKYAGCPEPKNPTGGNDTKPQSVTPTPALPTSRTDEYSVKNWTLTYWDLIRSKGQAYEKTLLAGDISMPQPSPFCEMNKQIGGTNIRIAYSSMGVKGRSVFGDLIPYGEKWRTGANASTKVSFTQPVTTAGGVLPAGTYALYSIPGEREWTFFFYSDTTVWGLPGSGDWKNDKVVVQVTVVPEKLSTPVENLLFAIDEVSSANFKLCLLFSDVKLAIPFSFSKVVPEVRLSSGFYQEMGVGALSMANLPGDLTANTGGYCLIDKNVALNGVAVPGGAYRFSLVGNNLFLDPVDTLTWTSSPSIINFGIRLTTTASGLKLRDNYICPVYLSNSAGVFQIKTGNQIYELRANLQTDEYVLKNIQIAMTKADIRADIYYAAARYYYEEKKDMSKALEWVDKCLEKGGDKFYILRLKATVLAELGRYKDAIAAANKSSELARLEGNTDYQKLNEKSIQEWKKKK